MEENKNYKIAKYGNNYCIDRRYYEGWMISYSESSFGPLAKKLAKRTARTGIRYANYTTTIDDGKVTVIHVYYRNNGYIYPVYVDTDIYESELYKYRWIIENKHKNSSGFKRFYIRGSTEDKKGNKKRTYLHRLVMGVHKDKSLLVVDHKSGNTLDNRRKNLRLVTNAINLTNLTKVGYINNLGVAGVDLDIAGDKYVAVIGTDPRYLERKSFSIKKFGKLRAFRKAMKWRMKKEEEYGYYDKDVRSLFKRKKLFRN